MDFENENIGLGSMNDGSASTNTNSELLRIGNGVHNEFFLDGQNGLNITSIIYNINKTYFIQCS